MRWVYSFSVLPLHLSRVWNLKIRHFLSVGISLKFVILLWFQNTFWSIIHCHFGARCCGVLQARQFWFFCNFAKCPDLRDSAERLTGNFALFQSTRLKNWCMNFLTTTNRFHKLFFQDLYFFDWLFDSVSKW